MGEAIQIDHLVKFYGNHQVLKGISIEIMKGEVYGLLGVNGAGKTTTLECVEGLRDFQSGNIIKNGRLGVQLQTSSLPKNIKVKEVIHLFSLWQKAKVDYTMVERLGVTPLLNKFYGTLSTGQMRRVHLLLSLLGEPDILFLDEPTAGLDVEGRVQIHEEIRRLHQEGKTIVLASHDMAEVEELCDRLCILKNGKIAFEGSVSDLKLYKREGYQLRIKTSGELNIHDSAFSYDLECNDYYIKTEHMEEELYHFASLCREQKVKITDIKVEHMGLEQIFMDIAREEKSDGISI